MIIKMQRLSNYIPGRQVVFVVGLMATAALVGAAWVRESRAATSTPADAERSSTALGRNLSVIVAFAGWTALLLFTTRETLATDTPANSATSWMVAITDSGNRFPNALYPTR